MKDRHLPQHLNQIYHYMKNKNSKKILIADDDHAILEAMQIILEDAGYEVEVTDGGKKALILAERLPDLILLDIWMSGTNGCDICQILKNSSKTAAIPIIMISAIKDTGRKARLAGADDYIEKPFEIRHLLKKVALYAPA